MYINHNKIDLLEFVSIYVNKMSINPWIVFGGIYVGWKFYDHRLWVDKQRKKAIAEIDTALNRIQTRTGREQNHSGIYIMDRNDYKRAMKAYESSALKPEDRTALSERIQSVMTKID